MRIARLSVVLSLFICAIPNCSSDGDKDGADAPSTGGGTSLPGGAAGTGGKTDDGAGGDLAAGGDADTGGTAGEANLGGSAGSANMGGAGGDGPTCPTTLLVGGTDVAVQGWTITKQEPASLTYGPDYVRLETTTADQAAMSGQLLLSYPGAVEAGEPFKLQIEMLVESVNPHNALDSAAAILGSFTPSFGTSAERSQMLALDADAIAWADNLSTASVQTNTYHTYVLSVDEANVASVSVDGVAVDGFTRTGFTTNGTIAIGDQTNDAKVDSAIRIRSVTKLCL